MTRNIFKNRKVKNIEIANSKEAEPLSDDRIEAALAAYAIPVSAELARAIRRYLDLLLRWNRKVNLTSLTDPHQILQRHFGESMFAAPVLSIQAGCLVDAGTGAGFPGLPLKMVRPELTVKLIEPNWKKTAFLAEVCRALALTKVEIVRVRWSDVSAARPFANYITCRALGRLEEFLPWAGRALQPNGCVILWAVEQDAQRLVLLPGWTWRQPIPIPLSKRRVLLVGQLKRVEWALQAPM
jgi:16S rRNA (guanine527-N7)-methyltransferase